MPVEPAEPWVSNWVSARVSDWETQYFMGEEGVVIPKHVVEEHEAGKVNEEVPGSVIEIGELQDKQASEDI